MKLLVLVLAAQCSAAAALVAAPFRSHHGARIVHQQVVMQFDFFKQKQPEPAPPPAPPKKAAPSIGGFLGGL